MFYSFRFKAALTGKLLGKVLFAQVLVLTLIIGGLQPRADRALAGQLPSQTESSTAGQRSALQVSPVQGKYIKTGNVKLFIPDVKLVDQNGNDVRFYTDLVKDKVVLISLFYTSCSSICPLQGEILSKLQTMLGERLGREVFLISISFDPATDTPTQIKAYASKLGAKRGWTFVTGEKEVMIKFLKDFVGEVPSIGLHSPTILVGNDRSGEWALADGLSSPDNLINTIQKVTSQQPKQPVQ
jgi:protein SCO1/2